MAVFAKSISNGFPMAAVIGIGRVMEAVQATFVSSTYWTERVGPTAALATLAEMERTKVSEHIKTVGERVQAGWKTLASKHGVPGVADGLPALCHFHFECGDLSRAVFTLFTQEMLDRGYLVGGGLYPTLAHTPAVVAKYLKTVDQVFPVLRRHLEKGSVMKALRGPVVQSGFARLT
jgi:glutamate-1-semialdehyde aminotransferase